MQIPAFPSFALRPAVGSDELEVAGPDGHHIGHLTYTTGWRGQAGTDTGPRRTDVDRAAADAVVLHTFRHGLIPEEKRPYASGADAQRDLGRITGLHQDLTDAAARAFFFHAVRQTQVAALLHGLETLRVERHLDTAAGCRRAARLVGDLQAPARELLASATGEEYDWLFFPLAELLVYSERAQSRLDATATRHLPWGHFVRPHLADEAIAAVRRAQHEVHDAAARLPRHPAGWGPALRAVKEACRALPEVGAARSAASCRTNAAALRSVATSVRTLAQVPGGRAVTAACEELTALADQVADRLAATAAVLEDVPRHGSVRRIAEAVARTEVGAPGPSGALPVRYQNREIGPVGPTDTGRWTADQLDEPYASPQGAIAALVRALDT